MKSSIKFLAVFALFFTFSFTSFAQKGEKKQLNSEQMVEKQANKMADRQTAMMTESLNLDEAQADRVNKVNLQYAQKEKEATRIHDEAIKKIKTDMQAQRMSEMKFILSATQFKAYTDMQAKKKARNGKKGDPQKKG